MIEKSQIENTLSFYNCPCDVPHIKPAGRFTDYYLTPKKGTTINKLKSRVQDFSFCFGCPVSIELENYNIILRIAENNKPVYNLFSYINNISNLKNNNILIGITPNGGGVIESLDAMPHLLAAGATGAGKSVFIHNAVICLSQSPATFTMIDLKRVELSIYNGLPFMNCPVINDAPAAVSALLNEVNEMESRYKIMEREKVRNYKQLSKPLAARVIVIDELADLMLNRETRKDIEFCIVKIAQLGRAAGCHLILATQRPDSTVITGLIKANIPARLAFKTASAIDSRVIGVKGAETLTGAGDCLYMSTKYSEPQRAQSCFVSDSDLLQWVNIVKAAAASPQRINKPKPKQKNNIFTRLFG